MITTDGYKPIKVGDPSFIYKGVYHPICWLGTAPYRPRVETLIIKDRRFVYANVKPGALNAPSDKRNHAYSIPGGSLDADSTKYEQAEAETNEEALISVKGLYPTGIQYYEKYDDNFLLKGGDMPLEYVGSISDVFVAEYDGPYDKSKIDEKDLDPDMANNGKFHSIISLRQVLRKEHISALLKSPYVDTETKTYLMQDANFIVGESVNPAKLKENIIYHGSIYKIDTFKPMSLDLGNAFQEPGWSTFCFLNHKHAKLFGAMRALQKLLQSADLTSDELLKKELTIDILDEQLVMSEDCINLIKDTNIVDTQVTYYVYTIDASNLQVCIGNDPYLPEVTFREEGVLPLKTECFQCSIMELREEIGLLHDSITNLDNHRKPINDYAEFNTHNYRTEPARKELEKAVKDGNLKPGDDIQEYMVANDLFFESDDIHIPDMVLEIDEPVLESKYPTECYGLPKRKAYPMPDERHVRSAIKFFNYVDVADEKELANNINKKIQQFHMSDIQVGTNNRFQKYYNPKRKVTSKKKIRKTTKPKKSTTMETSQVSKQTSNKPKPAPLTLTKFSRLKGKAKDLKEDEYNGLLMFVEDDADVIIWINPDTDKPIGFIATKPKSDGVWITTLDISNKYKNRGLSKQMIDVAIKECGASKLSVAKSNKVAYDMYKQSFTVYNETAREYFMKIINEAYSVVNKILNPVLEAGDDDPDEGEEDTQLDEPAENYANAVEDNDEIIDDDTNDLDDDSAPENTNDPDEGEEDTQLDEPAENYANAVEDNDDDLETDPDSESGEEEPDSIESLGGEPTDYTTDIESGDVEDGSDTDDDTEIGDDSTEVSEPEDTENDKNKNRFDNRELKNYFLLNDFLSVRELIVDITESTNGLILQTPEANQMLAGVIKTLQDIQAFIENFIQFQFSDVDYKFNLYYYNLTVTTLKMNLEILQKIMHLEENK